MKLLLSVVLALISNQSFADSCSSSTGVNLTASGKPFAQIMPRDQGRLGTCFAHAATDLLRSHVGGTSPFNIFDSAVNSGEDVDGGDPGGVVNDLIERGWACTEVYKFSNMFPSSSNNILTELEAVSLDMPVFYSNDPIKNAARQDRIALKASKLALTPENCAVCKDAKSIDSELTKLYKEVEVLNTKVSKLEKTKNTLDWGWVNYLTDSRDNSQIQADINVLKAQAKLKDKKITQLDKKNEVVQSKIDQGKHQLDNYSEEEAAQIVYYWGKKTYGQMYAIFIKYGIEPKYIPSLSQFLTERVKNDPVHGWAYAGRLYAYKIMKRALSNSCQPPNRQSIPKTIVSKSIYTKGKYEEAKKKIQSLLESSKPQGIAISLHADLLQKGSWTESKSDMHAVIIVGCRTVNNQLQYLIHNSWGQGCSTYYSSYTCTSGRVWVPASSAISASQEIEWIQNK